MARIKGGLNAKKKHNRVLKLAKGYRGARSKQYRVAKQSVMANQKHVGTTMNVSYYGSIGLEWGVCTWTPSQPDLYDIDFTVIYKGEAVDEIGSYFAMREIRIDGPNILLNGHPLYQRLILIRDTGEIRI